MMLPQFPIFLELVFLISTLHCLFLMKLNCCFHEQFAVGEGFEIPHVFFTSVSKGLKLFYRVQKTVLVFGRILANLKKVRSTPSKSQ